MNFADQFAVRSGSQIFHHTQNEIEIRFSQLRDEIEQRVFALSDDDVLAIDPGAWAEVVVAELALTSPEVDTAKHELVSEDRVKIDCQGWPGITYTLSEYGGPVVRPGVRVRLTVPATGQLPLLYSRLRRGGSGRKITLLADAIERVYEWPQARPASELQADVDQFLADLSAGVEDISAQITEGNKALVPFATDLLRKRQEEIRDARAFLGDLRLTVTRDPVADATIPALPSPRRPPLKGTRERSAAAGAEHRINRSEAAGPTLDAFYDHVVMVLGAVALGFERSPRRFAEAEEEALRDFMLVTLNSHYEGAATGETFNGNGRTDILVRHGIDNAFIGECKFWGGEGRLAQTFEQLLGYTTWKDNRLALILFVRNKKMQPVIETTRDWIAARPEFGGWHGGAPDGQLRCSLHWEDQARKEGRLTVFLVHLPSTATDNDGRGEPVGHDPSE